MSNNNPPFYIGQEVVCVDDKIRSGNSNFGWPLKNGNFYTVLDIMQSCCSWLIDIGAPATTYLNECHICKKDILKPKPVFFLASDRFRPIQRHPNAEVAEELKNIDVVEETLDVINEPVIN